MDKGKCNMFISERARTYTQTQTQTHTRGDYSRTIFRVSEQFRGDGG